MNRSTKNNSQLNKLPFLTKLWPISVAIVLGAIFWNERELSPTIMSSLAGAMFLYAVASYGYITYLAVRDAINEYKKNSEKILK